MSTSTGALGLAATSRKKSSRKVISRHLLGSAAVAGLVLQLRWTVCTPTCGAPSIYPSWNGAALEAPADQTAGCGQQRVPRRRPSTTCSRLCPQRRRRFLRPRLFPSSIMFNERFAASAPQGQAPSPVEATKLAEASPPVEAPKATAVLKPVDAPKFADASRKADAPKLAEVPKGRKRQRRPRLRSTSPHRAQLKPGPPQRHQATSVRDMAERAKAAVMSIASFDESPSMVEKLWGKQSSQASLLSYASADVSATGSLPDTRAQNPMLGGSPPYDRPPRSMIFPRARFICPTAPSSKRIRG